MHPGALVAIVVLAIAAVAVLASARAWPGQGFERIVRCQAGHLFTTTFVPGVSVKAVRLWNRRFERCPVGRHWTLVAPVDEAALSPEERAAARAHHDVRIP